MTVGWTFLMTELSLLKKLLGVFFLGRVCTLTPVLVLLGLQALFLEAVLVLRPYCFPLESPHSPLLKLLTDSVHIHSLVPSSRVATGFAVAWTVHGQHTVWFLLCGSSQAQPRKSPASEMSAWGQPGLGLVRAPVGDPPLSMCSWAGSHPLWVVQGWKLPSVP